MRIAKGLCLLMLAGDEPRGLAKARLEQLLAENPYIVAADGGANHLAALGLKPQLLVGDGDSLCPDLLKNYQQQGLEFHLLPKEKDFTDGEAALNAALAAGYRDFAVFGALGGALDHQLGNLLLPLAYGEKIESLVFYGEDCLAYYCRGQAKVSGSVGDTVSLLPLSPRISGLCLFGFRYPLEKAQTALGESLCLRNQLREPEAKVSCDEGILLIIHYPSKF